MDLLMRSELLPTVIMRSGVRALVRKSALLWVGAPCPGKRVDPESENERLHQTYSRPRDRKTVVCLLLFIPRSVVTCTQPVKPAKKMIGITECSIVAIIEITSLTLLNNRIVVYTHHKMGQSHWCRGD
jgi:hypothetical protein